MVLKDKFFYPATKASVHAYASSIFTPIINAECVTSIWVPMAGRRMWNKFLIENINLFAKELPNSNKYILVYVEPLDLTEESLSGYMRLMGKSFLEECTKKDEISTLIGDDNYIEIFEDENQTYTKLYETFKKIVEKVSNKGYRAVFFLGEFDELNFTTSIFYNNLKSLWSRFYPNLFYVFLSVTNLARPEMADKYKELNAAILQNVIFMPLRKGEDIEYVIDFFGDRHGHDFSDEEKLLIKKYCGGHPFLIRVLSKRIAEKGLDKIEQFLSSDYELISIVRRIFDLRTKNEKRTIVSIANGETPKQSPALERLILLGLVELNKDDTFSLFGKLLTDFVRKEKDLPMGEESILKGERLYINDDGAITFKKETIDEIFSNQEYRVLKYLLANTGKLRTREQIGEVMWGEESYEKFSNWAIDQLMSKVRKKISDLGSTTKLTTIRSRGYKLEA